MIPIVLAAFPGLLFSIQPPAHHSVPKQHVQHITNILPATPIDSCSTYIYQINNSTLYYNGKPVSQELLNKLGPLAAPVRYGLSLENIS